MKRLNITRATVLVASFAFCWGCFHRANSHQSGENHSAHVQQAPPPVSPDNHVESPASSRPAETVETVGTLQEVADQLEKVRGLKIAKMPVLAVLPDSEIDTDDDVTNQAAVGRLALAMLRAMDSSGTKAGFPVYARYYPDRGVVGIRSSVFAQFTPPQLYLVAAHELEHAAQAQFPDLPASSTVDAAMARAAVTEGDAELAKAALWASYHHKSIAEAFVEGSEFFKSYYGNGIPTGHADSLRLFDYLDGARFLLELLAIGGFSRIDAALGSPPRTTSEVLHIERFLKHEVPTKVVAPRLPDGLAIIGESSMGEFLVSEELQGCIPSVDTRKLAAGWSGDRLIIGKHANGDYAFAWTIVWNTAEGATTYANALAANPCLANFSFSGRVEWSQKGRAVAITRGFPDDVAKKLRIHMLAINSLRAVAPNRKAN